MAPRCSQARAFLQGAAKTGVQLRLRLAKLTAQGARFAGTVTPNAHTRTHKRNGGSGLTVNVNEALETY